MNRELSKYVEAVTRSGLLAVIAAILFLSVIRFRIADVPLERDEGEYAYSGQLILQGFPPYQLTYNMKFPGTYYAYAAIMAILGQTAWGIHAGLAVVNAATILFLYFLAYRLLGDRMAAAISAIAFGFLSVDRGILGVFGHATHFVVLAAVTGLLVLLRALNSRKASTFTAAGALLGLSVVMKQNGLFFLGMGIGIAFWSGFGKAHRNFRAGVRDSTLVTAGAAIPFASLCLVLFVQGVLGRFWFWTFQYAKEYVSLVSLWDGWWSFATTFRDITQANRWIWILAAAGFVLMWVVRWSSEIRIFLTALLFASFVATCPGFYFRQHYFIMLLPALALFCGVAILSIERLLAGVVSRKTAHAMGVVVFVVAIGSYTLHDSYYLFSMPSRQLSRSRYGSNPFVEAPELSRYIQSHTDVGDRIAVLGSEPEIYFYANRKSATGYIYTYELFEDQKYSRRMQDEMIEEITAVHPKYVVFVRVATSWLPRDRTEKIVTWSDAYLSECYSLAGMADIVSPAITRWVWDMDAANYKPQSKSVLFLFKAKTDAPCAARTQE
jgi:hypothetical protein